MCGVILTLGYLDPMYRGCTVNDYDFIKLDTGEGAYSVGGSVYPNGLGAARAIDARPGWDG